MREKADAFTLLPVKKRPPAAAAATIPAAPLAQISHFLQDMCHCSSIFRPTQSSAALQIILSAIEEAVVDFELNDCHWWFRFMSFVHCWLLISTIFF